MGSDSFKIGFSSSLLLGSQIPESLMFGITFYLSSLFSEFYKLENLTFLFYHKTSIKRILADYSDKIEYILKIAAFNSIRDINLFEKINRLRRAFKTPEQNNIIISPSRLEFFLVSDDLYTFLKKYDALTQEIYEEIVVLKVIEKRLISAIKKSKGAYSLPKP